ncbi:hypothetical protein ACFC4G_32200 [Streptomyces sp. NPDC056002]|uniref:DUF6959 family protein n=1 Tax=Streptomyces sp. NPDC056002 TaxID=3345675 RepID=UPI0035DF0A58
MRRARSEGVTGKQYPSITRQSVSFLLQVLTAETDSGSHAMVRLPARRFPGVPVQGDPRDPLSVLRTDLTELHRAVCCRRLGDGPPSDKPPPCRLRREATALHGRSRRPRDYAAFLICSSSRWRGRVGDGHEDTVAEWPNMCQDNRPRNHQRAKRVGPALLYGPAVFGVSQSAERGWVIRRCELSYARIVRLTWLLVALS